MSSEIFVPPHRVRVGRQRPDVTENPSIEDLLAQLGPTVEDVIQVLQEQDCRGPQNNDCFCPVAQYLAKHTGRAASATSNVCVIGEFTYENNHIDTFIGKEWARTPAVVSEVITSFDSGAFPQLRDSDRDLYGPTPFPS
jgi:hypothetical protein